MCTMILLDPDLDAESPHGRRPVRGGSDPSRKATSAKRTAAGSPPPGSGTLRLPSARTLASFLSTAQAAARVRGQVTVLLTTDEAIRKLNRKFRGKNKATDVLSFPAEGPNRGKGAEAIAGDLAISVTSALGQAAEQGHSLTTEIKVLILHGLLHLAGYDHEADNGLMARRERKLRAQLKIPPGLIERTGAPPVRTKSPPVRTKLQRVRAQASPVAVPFSPRRGAEIIAQGKRSAALGKTADESHAPRRGAVNPASSPTPPAAKAKRS
ncbi:MAG: rRNA maturation RNase YbeY [Terracidiphilus sp.]